MNMNRKKILIVDDSEDIRVLLSDFLQDEGYNVICAEDGSTTLMQAQDHHPDLTVGYNSCRVAYRTHAIDGLSENDFICAAKLDQLFEL